MNRIDDGSGVMVCADCGHGDCACEGWPCPVCDGGGYVGPSPYLYGSTCPECAGYGTVNYNPEYIDEN